MKERALKGDDTPVQGSHDNLILLLVHKYVDDMQL